MSTSCDDMRDGARARAWLSSSPRLSAEKSKSLAGPEVGRRSFARTGADVTPGSLIDADADDARGFFAASERTVGWPIGASRSSSSSCAGPAGTGSSESDSPSAISRLASSASASARIS